VLTVLLGSHALYWYVAMGAVERGFDAWVAQQRQAGWVVAFGRAERAGYPFAAALAVPGVRLASTGAERMAWRAERLRVGMDLWRPGHLAVDAAGAQTIRLGDGGDIPFRSDDLRLVMSLGADFPRWAELESSRLRADIPLPTGPAGMTVGQVKADIRMGQAASAAGSVLLLSISAAAIRLPDPARWALGQDIAAVELKARIEGPPPYWIFSVTAPELAAMARQWRDAGGTLGIERLHLRWGALDVTTSGSLGLDARLQPAGDGVVRMTGQGAALDALVAAGAIAPGAARAARIVFALFARPEGDGAKKSAPGEPPVELPFSLRDRRLMLRQFPLTRLPVLRWPGQ